MDGERTRYRIGELAQLSGLSVKTIRYYSNRGLVPPAERTSTGHRMYDERGLARLELVRALRELGASLSDIEKVVSRTLDVPALVAVQLEAVEAQLRVLRVRRAVLRAVAAGEREGKELVTVTRLAHISDEERKRIVRDFLDEVLVDLDVDPGLEARLRGALPDLPEEPSPEQVEAWVELAELVRDPDFRARIRQMAESNAAERRERRALEGDAMRHAAAAVAERGGAALAAGIEPESEAARPIVAKIVQVIAADGGHDDPAFRAELADRLEDGADPRAERYWQLLAVINGWPPVPTTIPAWRWTIEALRAHPSA